MGLFPISQVGEETSPWSGHKEEAPPARLRNRVSAHKEKAAGISGVCIYVFKLTVYHHSCLSINLRSVL